MIKRLLCFFGMHFGELFAGSVPSVGLCVMKKCACGRYWYDAAGPFSNPIWIPCEKMPPETLEAVSALVVDAQKEGEK